jgi:pimeloyl-ACP methyl ester carboxylesterase
VTVPTLPGIEARTVATDRLTTRVLFAGDPSGTPVLFIHGNLSSATWWETTMLALPEGFRGIAPDQRGYGGADPEARIDATRGMGDLSDDAAALLDTLGIGRAIVVGSSLGGNVVWRMIGDQAHRISQVIQVDPGSPYGYGATKGDAGEPVTDDFAGSGAGLVNPEMAERLRNGDTGSDSPFSPRNVFRTLIVKAGHIDDNEDAYVAAMLSTHFGPQDYPGDAVPSPNWPFAAPGVFGPNNALSPKYVTAHEAALAADPKPHVTWIRGAQSAIITDGGPLDPGTWGPSGVLPGYPGVDAYPPQPMVSQTRAWLELYRERGGSYEEVVLPDGGHVPYLDDPEDFQGVLNAHLRMANE